MYWFLVAGVVVSLSCVGGGGEGGSYASVRAAAIDIGDALCSRGSECGQVTDISACTDDFVSEVCEGGDCNGAPSGSSTAIGACIDAIPLMACDAENIPAPCQDVL